MGWLTLLKALLTLVGTVADIIRARQLMSAGEAEAVSKALADTVETLGVAKVVKARLAKATEAEIDEILTDDYRD